MPADHVGAPVDYDTLLLEFSLARIWYPMTFCLTTAGRGFRKFKRTLDDELEEPHSQLLVSRVRGPSENDEQHRDVRCDVRHAPFVLGEVCQG